MKPNWISWFVILLIAFGLPVVRAISDFRKPLNPPTTAPTEAGSDIQVQMMSKYIVGAAHASPETKPQLITQIDAMERIPAQRVAAAVLTAEVEGPAAAIEKLAAIEGDGDATAFRQFYADGTPLPESVVERYGFVADIARSTGKPDTDPQRAAVLKASQRTLVTLIGAGFIGAGGAVIATGLFVTAIVLISLGKLRPNVVPPVPANASAYVQAFAIYLGIFVFASIAIALTDHYKPDALPGWLKYVPMFAAVVLGAAWPLLRGVRWASLREDWGLHTGRSIFLEPLAGMAGYLAGLPIVVAGVGITLFLTWLTKANVSHPIQKELLAHPLQMVLLAVVWAPITEELLFRGALLSHLRAYFNPWVAAIVSGVIFAAIHPQGWAAIPILGSIGFVLAMVRQWRRSLLASIAAHALNNGMIVTLILLAAG
jgi:membrane protease YdiL (CAAX protease family)